MIVYEVTAMVEADIAEAFRGFMASQHISDLMATGCFESATLARSTIHFRCDTRPLTVRRWTVISQNTPNASGPT